jgi:LysR family glycine cleavage system transcriptional activator
MTARSRLPLNALRVFDAAARHGRFDAAASELSITPGAVSRQIKALEAELGLRLFDRFNRAVRLTEAGSRLAGGVGAGLSTIEEAVERIRRRGDGPLVVSVLHSLAARWLVPRLHSFHERYPAADILISASDRAVDLVREADLAIRYGPGPYPGLDARRLARSVMFPVCSPRLLEADPPLKAPADLARAVLLQETNLLAGEPDWVDWLAAAGVAGVDAAKGPRFSNTYLTLEAAMSGRGVAFVHGILALDDLTAGRLVRPFSQSVASPFDYWTVCLPERANDPTLRRFRDWLDAQARADGLVG